MVLQGCLFLCLAIVLSSYRTCCLPLPAGYDYNPTCAWDISPPFLVYLRNSKCWEIATHFIAYITNRTLLMWCKMAKYVWHHGGLFFSRKVTDVFFSSINDIFFYNPLVINAEIPVCLLQYIKGSHHFQRPVSGTPAEKYATKKLFFTSSRATLFS